MFPACKCSSHRLALLVPLSWIVLLMHRHNITYCKNTDYDLNKKIYSSLNTALTLTQMFSLLQELCFIFVIFISIVVLSRPWIKVTVTGLPVQPHVVELNTQNAALNTYFRGGRRHDKGVGLEPCDSNETV